MIYQLKPGAARYGRAGGSSASDSVAVSAAAGASDNVDLLTDGGATGDRAIGGKASGSRATASELAAE